MYKLEITELALNDLDSIVEYIAVQLSNPTAAGNFLDEVEECYGYLKSNPLIFAESNDDKLRKEGYRKALIKNYVLMFKIFEDSKTVTVYRLCLSSKNVSKRAPKMLAPSAQLNFLV